MEGLTLGGCSYWRLCAYVLQEDLNAVVMNYLITEGYAQAAAQFQEESRTAGAGGRLDSTLCRPCPDTRLLPATHQLGWTCRLWTHAWQSTRRCWAASAGRRWRGATP